MKELLERYSAEISGIISCIDRMILQGRMPVFSYAKGMAGYLSKRGIKIFDFLKFAAPITEDVKDHAEQVAKAANLKIDYIAKKNFRKEDKIAKVIGERGEHAGLVWIFSAIEPCTTYAPRYSEKRKAFLSTNDKKCLHYYFYFIDEDLGLCYLRVPTWCPFRLQFYCNPHHWLARQLKQAGIAYHQIDNAFVHMEDWKKAQEIADGFDVGWLHRKLDGWVDQYCPRLRQLEENYNWTMDTVEYASDVVFRRKEDLQALYPEWIRTAIHTVKPKDIATFLGKKLNGNYLGEMGNRYNTRVEGTRVRHSMGMVSIKMYDKFGQILRIETTIKDVTFFRHYRGVEQRDGSVIFKYAPIKKTIYSLGAVREAGWEANQRYAAFLAAMDDPREVLKKLARVSGVAKEGGRKYRGLNLFDACDVEVLEAIGQGEFCLRGMQNRTLREYLPGRTSGQVSRTIKRLRVHGLIKKTPHGYHYYLTKLGRQVIATGLRLKEFEVRQELAKSA